MTRDALRSKSWSIDVRVAFGFVLGVRLVGCAVGIDDEVELGLDDVEIAQQNARVYEVEDAECHVKMIDTRVGCFAGRFKAVDDEAADVGFEIEQIPVE